MLFRSIIKEPLFRETSRVLLLNASSKNVPSSICISQDTVPQKVTVRLITDYKKSNLYPAFTIDSRNIYRGYSSESKIYTKTGDGGTSSLYTGEKRSKCDMTFNALGNIDELSSFIGFAKEAALEKNHNYVEQLERIQCILQDIGTLIATPKPVQLNDKELSEKAISRLTFNPRHILELEGWIDQHTQSLPPLANFILPGGGRISASLHICRTVCRRAERSIVPLSSQDLVDKQVLVYINRLSDYLFTVARHASILAGKKETIYIRPKPIKVEELPTENKQIKKGQ